jgi:F0F1-type ATP synthase membrane subunit b/b'
VNVVDILKSQLSGDVLKNLGGALGAGEGDLSKILGAGIPAILGGLGKVASSKEGAEKVAGAVGGVDTGMLGDLVGMLSGTAGKQGGGMLGNLLGPGLVDNMASSIAKFTGLNVELVKTALSYLAPLVLGAIAKSFGGTRPNASAISGFFESQKSNIASALPQGFSLDSIQGFASLGSSGGNTKSSATPVVGETSNGGGGKLLLLALAIAALVGLYFYWDKAQKAKNDAAEAVDATLAAGEKAAAEAKATVDKVAADTMRTMSETTSSAKEKVDEALKAVEATAADAGKNILDKAGAMKDKAADLMSSGMDAIKGDFTKYFDGLTTKLGNVSDAAGADELLPDLESYSSKLDTMVKSANVLPSDAKSMLTDVVKGGMEKLNPIFDKLKEMPGLGDAFKQLIEQIKAKLMGLLQ